jgi:histone-lysine N-methyltransferase SETD3
MCVCSRNFGLQIDGNRTSAMVPHADMLNHYRPRETKWAFDDEKQAFTITS